MLKRELEAEPAWQEFSTQATQTRARVQQTALAALAPPRQRGNARSRNVAEVVGWGGRILQVLDAQSLQPPEWDPPRVEHAVGWVHQYRQEVEQWRQFGEVGTIAEQLVKAEGVFAHSAQHLQQRLAAAGTLSRPQQLCTELLQFVRDDGAKANAGERWVGRSEVIEAIFGQWKHVEGEHARSGLTGVVLALGALVAPTTPAVMKHALERVPTKTVLAWCREKLGKPVQALRRTLFVQQRNREQKQDQLPLAA